MLRRIDPSLVPGRAAIRAVRKDGLLPFVLPARIEPRPVRDPREPWEIAPDAVNERALTARLDRADAKVQELRDGGLKARRSPCLFDELIRRQRNEWRERALAIKVPRATCAFRQFWQGTVKRWERVLPERTLPSLPELPDNPPPIRYGVGDWMRSRR